MGLIALGVPWVKYARVPRWGGGVILYLFLNCSTLNPSFWISLRNLLICLLPCCLAIVLIVNRHNDPKTTCDERHTSPPNNRLSFAVTAVAYSPL